MLYTLDELVDKLHIKNFPKAWYEIYPRAMIKMNEGAFLLDEQYIRAVESEIHCLNSQLENVLAAAKIIREDGALAAYAYLLYFSMTDRASFNKYEYEIELPKASEPLLDFLGVFPLIPHFREGAKKLREHGLPDEIVYATMRNLEEQILVFQGRYGHPGIEMRYIHWHQHFIVSDILSIGRLNFEMKPYGGHVCVLKRANEYKCFIDAQMLHKSGQILGSRNMEYSDGAYYASITETDDYFEGYPVLETGLASDLKERINKSEWKIVLRDGDPIINVHIPGRISLSNNECESAYKRAVEIFGKYYPEFKYKAFVCNSWLMDKQLARFLKPSSNIVLFQNKYMRIPCKSDGQAVFVFLYPIPVKSLDELPENTSLERGVKGLYKSGGCIYEQGGIFFI